MALTSQDKLKQRLPPFVVQNELVDDLTKVVANRLDDLKGGEDTIRNMFMADTASEHFLDEILEDHGLFRSEDEADYLLRIRAKNIIRTYEAFGTRGGIEDYLAFLTKTKPYLEDCWSGKWAWIIGFSAIGIDTYIGAALQFNMVLWNQTELTEEELEAIVDGIVPVHTPYGISYVQPVLPWWGEKADMDDYPHLKASWDLTEGTCAKSILAGLLTLDTTGSTDKCYWAEDAIDRQFWPTHVEHDIGWTVQFRVRVDADNAGSKPGHLVEMRDGVRKLGFYLKTGGLEFTHAVSDVEMDLSDSLHTIRVTGGGALGTGFKLWVDGTLKKEGTRPAATGVYVQWGDVSDVAGEYQGKTVWDYFRIYTAGAVEWGEATGYFYETGDDFLTGTNTGFDVEYNALVPSVAFPPYECSRESEAIDLGVSYPAFTWIVDWLDYKRQGMDVDVKMFLSFSDTGTGGWSSWIDFKPNEIVLSADIRRYVKYKLEVTIASDETLSDYAFKQWTLKGLPTGLSTFVDDWSEMNLPLERKHLREQVPV